jgi:lysozyme
MNHERLQAQLKVDEGVRYEIYKDHLGYLTFGVGHLVTESDPEHGRKVGDPVRHHRVDAALDQDIAIAVEDCKNIFQSFDTQPDIVQEILVNMSFNLGGPNLRKFKRFIRSIEDGDYPLAAYEGRDSKWYNQVTNRAERLMSKLEVV